MKNGSPRPFVSFFEANISGDGAGAEASYKTTGTAPNRVFTIEMLNWKLLSGLDSAISLSVSLFEGSNAIEFSYRREPNYTQITNYKGIAGASKGEYHFISIKDDSIPPDYSNMQQNSLADAPSNYVYRISRPSCPPPYNQFYIDATDTTVLVNWVGWKHGANQYIIEYDTVGFAYGNGKRTANITSSSFNISGLSPSTQYDFYVLDSCGISNLSRVAGPFTFSTALQMPYFESFDSLTKTYGKVGNLYNGWNCKESNGFVWEIDQSNSRSGTGPWSDHSGNFLYFLISAGGYNGYVDTTSLYSPVFNLDTFKSPTLLYWSHRYGADHLNGHVDVYANGQWHLAEDLIVGQSHFSKGSPYELRSVDLKKFNSNFIRCRWRTGRNGNLCNWAIDDISIVDNSIYLQEPVNDSIIKIVGNQNKKIRFKWLSELTLPFAADYSVLIDTNKTGLNNPLIQRLSNNSGADTIFTIKFLEVDSILASMGKNTGDTIHLWWTVYREANGDTVFSEDTFRISVIRDTVLFEFRLIDPPVFPSISIQGKYNDSLEFTWQKSTDHVKYVLSLHESNILPPLYEQLTTDTASKISFYILDTILDSKGVSIGKGGALYWNVHSTIKTDSLSAENGPRKLNLTRGIITDDIYLLSPQSDTLFVFVNDIMPIDPHFFRWTKAQLNGDSGIIYNWILDKVDRDFSNPLLQYKSNFQGAEELKTISNQNLVDVFNSAGFQEGDTLNAKWTVVSNMGDTAVSSFKVNIFKDLYFNINDFDNKHQISLYPNPLTIGETIKVSAQKNIFFQTLFIIDINGVIVQVDQINETSYFEFDLDVEKSGAYIIILQTKDNGVFTKQLLVE